jgi:hypothetical protein
MKGPTSIFKVTWTTSQRIHSTSDGRTTICGHVFDGPDKSIHGQLHKYKRKRHCRTCFVEKPDFKAPWLPACEADTIEQAGRSQPQAKDTA